MKDENPMFLTDFILTVMDMRRFQKEYFSTRSKYSLQSAKKMEQKVDKMIVDYQNAYPRMEQGKLC